MRGLGSNGTQSDELLELSVLEKPLTCIPVSTWISLNHKKTTPKTKQNKANKRAIQNKDLHSVAVFVEHLCVHNLRNSSTKLKHSWH